MVATRSSTLVAGLLVTIIAGCAASRPAAGLDAGASVAGEGGGEGRGVLAPPPRLPDASDRARLSGLIDARRTARPEGDYRIGPNDVLRITVFELDDLDRTVRVEDDGRIRLPLIGTVEVAERTAEQVELEIERRLGASYVRDPQVDLAVETFGGRRVGVFGEVGKPGVYALSRDRTLLLDVLGEAEGLSATAAEYVELYPATAETAEELADWARREQLGVAGAAPDLATARDDAIRIPIADLLSGACPLPLVDGDRVQIPRRGDFFVGGEVRTPGRFDLVQGTTLLSAIAQAGGLGEYPEAADIQIIRVSALGSETRVVDYDAIVDGASPDVALVHGDKVIVPRDRVEAGVMGVVKVLGTFVGVAVSPF